MPTAGWIVLLIAGGVITALIVSVVAVPSKSAITTQLAGLPSGSTAQQFNVRYDIDKPSHADVTCTVQALGGDHSVVGSISDTTPARNDSKRSITRQVTVPTTKQAVSAQIVDCEITARH